MIKFSSQRGYTLIETLVALTLLLLFLFLVNDLVPILLLKSGNNLKLQAITEAKNQLEKTRKLELAAFCHKNGFSRRFVSHRDRRGREKQARIGHLAGHGSFPDQVV